ncbi:MAG: RHS repeat-associated core domain-containing protein [Desulfatibacillaceae bacterium]
MPGRIKIQRLIPVFLFVLSILVLFLVLTPGDGHAYDKEWDTNHNTPLTENPPPDTGGPPGPDTGGPDPPPDPGDGCRGDSCDEPPDPDPDPPPDPPDDPDEEDEEDEEDDCEKGCDNECKPDSTKSPVYVKTGSLVLSFSDFEIAGVGPALGISRTYNSKDRYNGPFGHGWASNAFAKIIRVTDGRNEYAILRKGSGTRVKFRKNADGTFSPLSASVTDTLSRLQDGTYVLNCSLCSAGLTRPVWHFDSNGNLTLIEDENGNELEFTYDAQGHLHTVRNMTTLRWFEVSYTVGGKVSTITDSHGRTWDYRYDNNDNLISVTDPLGYAVEYSYDLSHRLLSVTDKAGYLSHVITWDDQGRVASHGTEDAVATYQYMDLYTQKTDALGRVYKFYFDQNGNVIRTVLPDGTEVTTVISTDTNPVARTDASGNTWTYQYNAYGQVTVATDPMGYTTTYEYDPRFQKVASETDPLGNTTTYQYDDRGNLVRETGPLGCFRTIQYNPAGQVTMRTDPMGYTTTYQYDDWGNMVRETDSSGNFTEYAYDDLGRQISMTDKRGNTWSYEYDALGRPVSMTDPGGGVRRFTHDGVGNRIEVTDERGNSIRYEYDAKGRRTARIDQLGNRTEWTYDTAGNPLTVTDPAGNVTTRTYDDRNKLLTETDPLGNTTTYTYDASGNRLTKTDPRGNTWTYAYDAMDRLLAEGDPLGYTTTYEYDPLGRMVKRTDPAGNVSYNEWDAAGNLVTTIIKVGDTSPTPDSDDVVTRYTFDCLGRRLALVDPMDNTTTWTYDFRGKKLTETNALAETRTWVYDENGNVREFHTATGNTITYTYNELNLLTEVGDLVGMFEAYQYDATGNRTFTATATGDATRITYTTFNKPGAVTDPEGNTTIYNYDSRHNLVEGWDRMDGLTMTVFDEMNRVVEIVDPENNVSQLGYDPSGNLRTMIDPENNTTTYTFDAANRLETITYADGTIRGVEYNAAGKIIKRVDRNSQVVTYTRNSLGRITARNYPDSSSYTYTYDKLGRTLTATNNHGTVTFTYDAAGRIVSTSQNGTTTNIDHDLAARTRTVYYPDGATVRETYTVREKIATVEDVETDTVLADYTYDDANRPETLTFGNGLYTTWNYTPKSQVATIAHKEADGTVLARFDYAYNAEGDPTATDRGVNVDRSERYAYDAARRLVSVDRGEPDQSGNIPAPDFEKDYVLDGVGNWTSVTTDGATQTRVANTMNQYATVDGIDLVYDSAGNLIDDGAYEYMYDYENQLTRVTRKSDSHVMVEYTMDAVNRRVEKTVDGVTTTFIYDDSRVIQDRAGGGVVAQYVYGNRLDEVVAMYRDSGTYYHHADVLGSTMAVSDASGAIVETYGYDPYGMPTIMDPSGNVRANSTIGVTRLYTGRDWEEEVGLYYYRARYLNPRLGRYMSPDPLGYADGLNLYEYAHSNPLRYIDPRGTECESNSLEFDAGRIKQYLPGFLNEKMGDPKINITYKKCENCCSDGPKKGETVTDKEISVAVAWSGDTGYIPTPWGISWDIDVWVYQTKGFIGLVAKVSWGVSGSLAGGTDNCYDKYKAEGCVTGSVTVEAMFGAADEDTETGTFKAYVSGGVSGEIQLCLVYQRAGLSVQLRGKIGGTIKGVVGVWKWTYEKEFWSKDAPIGPWMIYSL